MASPEAVRLLASLRSRANVKHRIGMARFGITVSRALGVSVADIRSIAKGVTRDHRLAAELWATGIHEARILASIVDEPEKVTERQMDAWVKQFDSWDLCDQACGNLFDQTPQAWRKAREWSRQKREFEKRAGFALMACLAWHRKDAPDSRFLLFLEDIERESSDPRNFVKKAVNWALRQVGKRSPGLKMKAAACARRIALEDFPSARWIARDALRELGAEQKS